MRQTYAPLREAPGAAASVPKTIKLHVVTILVEGGGLRRGEVSGGGRCWGEVYQGGRCFAGGGERCSEVEGVNFRKGGGVRRWTLLLLIFFSFSCLS